DIFALLGEHFQSRYSEASTFLVERCEILREYTQDDSASNFPVRTISKKFTGPIWPPLKVNSIPSAGEPGAVARQSGEPRVSWPTISSDSMLSSRATAPDVSPPATITRGVRVASRISRSILPSLLPIEG